MLLKMLLETLPIPCPVLDPTSEALPGGGRLPYSLSPPPSNPDGAKYT
jgi:hypothetical protein